ncbi:MAG TPA: hypothetical protein PK898_06390 [Flexilinea sp.]|nr:hypothetical protein [Flexilinea sp.]
MKHSLRFLIPSGLISAAATLGLYQMLPLMHFNTKLTALLIGFFLAGTFFLFFFIRFLAKKISINHKMIGIFIVASVFLSILITFLFHLSFPQKEIVLPNRKIHIDVFPDQALADKTKIQFLSLYNGYRGISLSDFSTYGDWKRENDQLVLENFQNGDALEFKGKAGRNIHLYFMVGPRSGKIRIDWGDGSSESYDLSSPMNEEDSLRISHDYGPSAGRFELFNFLINLLSVVSFIFALVMLYWVLVYAFVRKRTKAFKTAFIIISLSTVLIRAVSVYTFPLGWDEGTYSRAAMRYADKALSFQWKEIPSITYNHEHPALVKLTFAVPVILDGRPYYQRFGLNTRNNAMLGKEDYTIFTGRIVSAVFSLWTVQALAVLIHPFAAFFFMIHSLAEEFGAQARLEAMPMLFSFLSIWFFSQFLKGMELRQKKGNLKWLILSALFLGMTAASKIIYCVIAFAILAAAIESGVRQRNIWKELFGSLVLFGIIALGSFFIFNPSVWYNPIGRISMMIGFHENYQAKASDIYPWWQPIVWVSRSVAHHSDKFFSKSPLGKSPEHFFFSADELIFILACIGFFKIPREYRIYFYWFIFGLFFLFIWGTKWVQYACVVTAPLCIAAYFGSKKVSVWLNRINP